MMLTMVAEMNTFAEHHTHVIHYKTQIRELLATFQHNEIIIKVDFIQNIVHGREREIS
jgi:flagellar biosynthesis regulator FlbT